VNGFNKFVCLSERMSVVIEFIFPPKFLINLHFVSHKSRGHFMRRAVVALLTQLRKFFTRIAKKRPYCWTRKNLILNSVF